MALLWRLQCCEYLDNACVADQIRHSVVYFDCITVFKLSTVAQNFC